MYFKALAFILLLNQFRVQTEETKESCTEIHLKRTRSNTFDSLRRFKNTILSFFDVTLNRLEKRRQKIKKSFLRFMNEVFYDKKSKCTEKLSLDKDMESIMSTPDLVVYHGYQTQTHTVLTADGYMLTIHRILPINFRSIEQRIAILSHGLLGSSRDWILLGPNQALPYLLSDMGYDVWLPNFRGNKYTSAHSIKQTNSADFWNFSWHEIGLLDIPAIIDYVRETTEGKSQINFIAYSMSTSALLVLLSSSLGYKAILKSVALLAPLIFMENVKGPLKYLAELYSQDQSVLSDESSGEFQLYKLFKKTNIKKFCKDDTHLCNNPLLFWDNKDKKISNLSMKAKIDSNAPSGGSTKSIIHYLQLIKNGQFQMFDSGETKNYVKYGRPLPPSYQLKNIKTPLILINAVNDSLSTVADISKFIFHTPGVIIHHVVNTSGFSHFDFLWADSAPQLVYKDLIKELQKINSE